MDNNLKKQVRGVWVVVIVLFALLIASMALTYFSPKVATITNYIGQKGEMGENGQTVEGPQGPQGPAGYTPIKGVDYVDGPIGAQGATGAMGPTGAQGAVGPQGIQGDQGPVGDKGDDGKTPEFRCHSGDYQWRYVGDEDWQTLKKNSAVCQSAL